MFSKLVFERFMLLGGYLVPTDMLVYFRAERLNNE